MAYMSDGPLDGAPDGGTLGGTLADPSGETSATLGGALSPEQAVANEAVNSDSFGYGFGDMGFLDPGSFSLGSLFGFGEPTGLPTTPTSDFTPSFGDKLSSFFDSPFGKGLRGLASLSPLGQLANLAYGASKGNFGQVASSMIGGLPGTIAGMGVNAAMGRGPSASNFGSLGGGMLGSAVAGPFGGMLGSQLGGSALSGAKGYGGSDAAGKAGNFGGNLDLGSIATGIAQSYLASQAAKDARQSASGMTSGVNQQLEDMFGANSASARQLRQELDRRDAASGRRSQYGPREVELQARLAQLRAQAQPGIMNANTAANKASLEARNAQRVRQGQMLSTLYGMGRDSGLFKNLGSIFGNNAPAISAGEDLMAGPMSTYEPLPEVPNVMADSGSNSNWWDDL